MDDNLPYLSDIKWKTENNIHHKTMPKNDWKPKQLPNN